MKKLVLIFLFFLCSCLSNLLLSQEVNIIEGVAAPQKKKFIHYNSYNEIAANAGIYTLKGKQGFSTEGTVYAADFSSFMKNGLGIRYGASYADINERSFGIFSIPLKGCWRTPVRDYGLANRITSSATHIIMDPESGLLYSLLTFLFYRCDVNIGLTPSYVFSTVKNSSGLKTYDKELVLTKKFMLSADIGARYSMRIWRFVPQVSVNYGYMLVNPFKFYNSATGTSTKLINSYLSVNFGLAFLL